MSNELFSQWSNASQNAIKSLTSLTNINSNLAEQLLKQQQGFISQYVSDSVEQIELISKSHDYKDLLSIQAKLTKSNTDKLMTHAKELNGIFNDAKTEFSSWVEKGIEAAVQPIDVPKAKKAA